MIKSRQLGTVMVCELCEVQKEERTSEISGLWNPQGG